MEEESWSSRGWRRRGGGCILKFVIAEGVQFSYIIIWGGGGGRDKVLIHHTFLKTTAAPLGRNERSVP